MKQDRKELIKKMIPKAVLHAQNEESAFATFRSCFIEETIGIWNFPFRIGRECRIKVLNNENVITSRHSTLSTITNNDLYIVDIADKLQISREHLSIVNEENKYFLIDKSSTCGTYINEVLVEQMKKHELKDGDIIKLGSAESPYVFEFVVLDGEVI